MRRALIGLGSNLGDRHGWLRHALGRLDADTRIEVRATSPLFETAPVGGPPGQGPFLNACAELRTSCEARDLLARMLDIERETGRVRSVKDAPRTLDLDLLLYGDEVIEEEGLCVPHPCMTDRPFVMVPAAAVAGTWVHPVARRTLDDLTRGLTETPGVALHGPACWWRRTTEAAG